MRTFIGSVVLTLLLLTPGNVEAQKDIETRLQQLEQDIAKLKEDSPQLKKDVSELGKLVITNSENIKANKDNIGDVLDRIKQLQADVDDNSDKLQYTIVPDSDGRYVLAIQDMKQRSQDFRQQLIRTAETRLYLQNDNGGFRYIYINGQKWRARKGQSYVPVPFGPVRIRLAGRFDSVILNTWSNGDKKDFKGYYLSYSIPALDPSTPTNTVR